jgi:transcriptional regulator with XRE-family HTH domain
MKRTESNNKLKTMRLSRGLSQQQLAELTGLNMRTLQNYEQGVADFNGCNIKKIFDVALVLDCDVEDILTDENVIATIREYQEA